MLVAQVLAVTIFLLMFLMVVTEKIERHIVTLVSGGLMLAVVFGACMRDFKAMWNTLNLEAFIKPSFWYSSGSSEASAGINWETIVFILGMMIMVEGMGNAGFFRWLCIGIAKLVRYKTIPIFIAFIVMSTALAMFIDSITVILFLASVTIELSKLLKFNPVPMIISEIFCANLGGSATMCGDPPNIIIGTSLGYSFGDFITNTGFMVLCAFPFILVYFLLVFSKELKKKTGEVDVTKIPSPTSAIVNKKDFVISTIIFAIAIVLLVTHSMTGLTVSTIGVLVSVLTLLAAGKNVGAIIKKLDYKTLLFFVGLFVVVGGLEQTGILEVIAQFIETVSGGKLAVMIVIILWVSAFASAFVDNIPFAATMIPVIQSLSVTANIPLTTLAWALAIGTDVGGSATPIGASANVVGISAAAQDGHVIGWGKYCKYNFPATVIVLAVSMICIFVRYV